MSTDYILGANAVLYYSTDALDGRPGDAGAVSTYNDVSWTELENVQDVDQAGDAEKIDATTRSEAKSGWTSEILGPSSGQLTFTVRHKPNDPAYIALRNAWLFKQPIALLDMDGPMTTDGRTGLVANFSINFSMRKPVKGVITVDVTASVAGYPDYVEVVSGNLQSVTA